MPDHYSVCETALMTRLRTLTSYFPAGTGKSAGWQVSDDDTVFSQGGDYFVIVRPGEFPTVQKGLLADVSWHVKAVIYARFIEYKTSWGMFKAFRSDIFNLLNADPSLDRTNGVYSVTVSSKDDAGRLLDTQGNPMNWIAQLLDVTITQRIKIR